MSAPNQMPQWSGRWFLLSAGVVLLTTGLAKLLSISGGAKILALTDPIVGISFRHLLLVAGAVELLVAIFCLSIQRPLFQMKLVAWLATSILIYRLALVAIGWHRPCPCLGYFFDAVHVNPEVADTIMKAILAYLLLGSYLFLAFSMKFPRFQFKRPLNIGIVHQTK
jgi:hypothetical protein